MNHARTYCDAAGKVGHATYRHALKALRGRSKAEYRVYGDWRVRPYRCRHCNLWHVGHAAPRKPQRR